MTEALEKNDAPAPTAAPAAPAASDVVQRVAAVLEHHAGMRVQSAQRRRLERAIETRMRVLGEADGADYADRVEQDAAEWRRLVPGVAVGETRFFRDRERWDAVERDVIPGLIARRGGRPLRLWSAGCATGQEAWGLAMVCDRLRDHYPGLVAEVIGSDINPDALAAARDAVYPESALRGVARADRARFFEPGPGQGTCRVRADLRPRVRFEELNLLAWAGGPHRGPAYDLILCLRVLIYLSPEATERVLAALAGALAPGGVLLVGHTESLTAPPGCVLEWLGGSHGFRRQEPETPTATPSARKPRGAAAKVPPEPPTPVEGLHLAWEAAVAERYTDAEAHLAGVARTGEALRLSAWIRLARGDEREAAKRIDAALAEAPTHPEPHFLAGMLALARNRPEEATAHLKHAVYLDPGFAPAHFHLAALLAAAGREDEARRAWHAAERASETDAERIRRYVGFDAAAFAQVCRGHREEEDGGG